MFGHYLPLRGKGQSEFADLVYSYVIVQFLGASSEVLLKFVISVVIINQINFTLDWAAWLVCLLFSLADEYIKKRARKSHSKVVYYFSKTTLFFNFDRVLLFTLFYSSRNFIQLSKINIY
jgi:hypothetical protein